MIAPSYYVGVGASAGGLEAIELFFKQMPADSGLAFVVVQHLSPDYKSLMAELLSKHTRMPVVRAEDGMTVEANRVYLIPPKKNLTIFHGKLLLHDQDPTRAIINLPIDVFLTSLAEDQGEKAVAIILSGTGSDGTRGIRTVKEAGGMIMVQSEESAKFDGMPKSAINTGLPDFVLAPEEMPKQLISFVRHPYAAKAETTSILATDEDGLTRIFALLRERTKLDFTYYKPSTVVRRIERRMTVNQIQELRDYVRHLETTPAEVSTLYREMLIGVTSFFRDRGVWDYLATDILPQLFSDNANRQLRFWVAACSSGEEAYTLGILCREAMDHAGIMADVKIFATDVDKDAIVRAGNGIFPESIAADIPTPLLVKYFTRRDNNFQIARHIREMVVFAQHNILKDPPFTNIDLVSCRNMLIYLQPVLQKKVMSLFSFSLNPAGVLLLGTSETVGDLTDLYDPCNQKWKAYRTKGKRRLSDIHEVDAYDGRVPVRRIASVVRGVRTIEEDRLLERLLQSLSADYLPLGLVVNEQLELLHVLGDSEGFLHMPAGRTQNDVTRFVAKDLAIPLATGLQKVFRNREDVVYSHVHVKQRTGTVVVELRIRALSEKKGQVPLAVVLISPEEAPPGAAAVATTFDLSEQAEQRIRDLEGELQFTRENLQATVEELETSNEELQATNEELLASNEELQSTNEELQSVNEELYTVNAEYQSKITQLSLANNDLDNLLASTNNATLFLDEDLRVRRFTPGLTPIFHLTHADIGRPVTHLAHQLGALDLVALARQVQIQRSPVSREVLATDGTWFLLQVGPYRVSGDSTAAIVLTLVDVTALKKAEHRLVTQTARSELAQRAAKLVTWEWTVHSDGLTWGAGAEALLSSVFGRLPRTRAELVRSIHPADRAAFDRASALSARQGGSYDVEYRLVGPNAQARWFGDTGEAERDDEGRVLGVVGVLRDIEQRKTAQLAMEDVHRHYRQLFDEAPHLIYVLDAAGRIAQVNAAEIATLGYRREDLLQKHFIDLVSEEDREGARSLVARLFAGTPVLGDVSTLVTATGERVPIEIHAIPELSHGVVVGARAVCRDLRIEAARRRAGPH